MEIRLGPVRAWLVCHPRLVHEMLRDTGTFDKGGPLYERLRPLMGGGVVTCPHSAHRRQRRLLQPAFRPARVAAQIDAMGEEALAVCRGWRSGRAVDVSAAMMTLTTGAVSRVLFSDSLDAARTAEVRDCLAEVVHGLFVRTVVPVDVLFRLPTPANRRYRDAVARLHRLVDAVIAERRAGARRDDLLGTLLAAAERDDSAVTEQEVHDQLVSLLLTGSESPSLCLSSAFSLLARHPEAERRLHTEVDTVLGGRPRPGPDDLPRLVHTRAVIEETLRHSPPGWLFTRVTTRDVDFGGRRLPRGTTVLYSPYLLHHTPASFPEPERFRPERWLSGGGDGGPYSPMIPFSAGSRKCLGDSFAMAQTTVALATIARHWRLRHPPGPVTPVRPTVTLGPRSLPMICVPRTGDTVPAPARAASGSARDTALSGRTEFRKAGDQDADRA
ncbi:cytochrome P450 [Streptomyces sp. NPDC052013]|uniref:cytochrome P450 n=1 Tax=Streptomyces sp. NPDC052013 TaxID=3365679 RepID=UPI0037CD9E63